MAFCTSAPYHRTDIIGSYHKTSRVFAFVFPAILQMIGVLAESERSMMVEHTQAGMKVARRRGVRFGRKRKLTAAQVTKARKLIEAGERVEDADALWHPVGTRLYRR